METKNEEQKMSGWVGTVFGVLGALLVAANIGMNDVGYSCFLVGSSFSLYYSIKMRDNSQIILWAVFFAINVFGLFNYIK
jgi:hypothetical protein